MFFINLYEKKFQGIRLKPLQCTPPPPKKKVVATKLTKSIMKNIFSIFTVWKKKYTWKPQISDHILIWNFSACPLLYISTVTTDAELDPIESQVIHNR